MKSRWRWIVRRILLGLVCLGLLFSIRQDWPDSSTEEHQYSSIIRNRYFDFVRWELEALGRKALYSLAPAHSYLRQEDQQSALAHYFDRLAAVQSLDAQISLIYSDPAVIEPEVETIALVRQVQELRERLEILQVVAEGVLDEQTAAVLAKAGITTGGRAFPPVKLQFTPLPAMLIISARDKIEAIHFFPLETGIDTPARAEMEAEIDSRLGVSSLVSDIGGLAAYPAMMLESSSAVWVIETTAHEWAHHFLTLHPLGLLYDTDPQLRTMNETTASIVGSEIGRGVLERYYPAWLPDSSPVGDRGNGTSSPPAFDFRAEMRITRVRVDELLAQGAIQEAEAYMETRRQVFWDNGYQIRKINQAYFAFHGAYADEPGAPGADPVGPAVLELRERSASLSEFLETISALTSFEQLETLLEE
jgi:hypothetical protein